MSHGITKRDRQEARHMGWHNLTQINEVIDLKNNWLTKWDIQEVGLQTAEGVEVPFKILTGTDDQEVIGKPFAGTYTPVSNKAFLDMIGEAISGVKGAVVESVGSVNNRGRVFVSLSIKGMDKYVIGEREFYDYLSFGNSHDMSTAVWVNGSNTCIVCNNTYDYNLHSNSSKVRCKVKHSKDVVVRLDNIVEIVDAYAGQQAKWKAEFNRLMNKPMKEEQARNFYAGFLLRNDNAEHSVRELGPKTFAKVERLTELFTSGRGNNGDDRADCFQGGTEFYSHFSTRGEGKNEVRQAFSSRFGLGKMAKTRLWDSIRDDKTVNSLIATGTKAIKEYVN
jgi:hypothetical protein